MAIELHHLHPGHDDEVTRLKARIAELERMDTEHTLQIAKMNGYIHHLEEELEKERRWRRFPDEKPKEWETVVVKFSDGFYDLAVYLSNGQGWDIGDGLYHKSEEVTRWIPLPTAPEEEQ